MTALAGLYAPAAPLSLAPVPRAADAAADALAPGWEQAADDAGRVYYYHRASEQTTWERPGVDLAAADPQPA